MTSIGASILFPLFMYESILKTANNDKDFEFKVRSTSYPVMKEVEEDTVRMEASVIVFIMAIAYSQFLSIIVGNLTEDRISRIKFFQSTQGMQLSAYWITNFFFDLLKLYLVVFANYLILIGFDIDFGNAFYTLFLYPWGAIPFTYFTTFIFMSTSVAQSFTIFFNFVFMLILPIAVHFMRQVENMQR